VRLGLCVANKHRSDVCCYSAAQDRVMGDLEQPQLARGCGQRISRRLALNVEGDRAREQHVADDPPRAAGLAAPRSGQ
jgi:hypothetical protein